MINLVTLGSLQLNGETGQLLAGRRKILALLACLVRRAPEPVRRAELTTLLWPDRSENHAKQSLRQALAELRPILGDALTADGESIRIDSDALAFDARAFEDAVRHERWEEAAHLWGGDFLHGLETVAGKAWAQWLAAERATLRQAAAQVFRALHAVAERRDDRKASMEWSHKWCDVAPLDEDAFTARITSLVRAGRPVDAAVCFEGFVRKLHNESRVPSAAFESLRQQFAAGRPAPEGKVVVRGTVTLSGLSQLSVDARSVAEAASVIDGPADAGTLQAVSAITSYSFRTAIAELVQHGILAPAGESRWEFTSPENRNRVFGVISGDRRLNLQRSVAARLGTPVEGRRPAAVPRQPAPVQRPGGGGVRPGMVAVGTAAALLLVAVANWAARASTANAVELEPGSTVLLDQVRDVGDPTLAGAVNTAARLGLSQSRHVALYRGPRGLADTATNAPHAERIRALARAERIPRIITLDISGTDSALRVAARLIDGSSGAVLGEESIETGRARLVDDLDRLLRKVRVTLGEPEAIVRDSSRLLREVASSSIEALSAYADGLEAWSRDNADSARASWTRALERDSSFALAELALANDAFTRDDAAQGDRWVRRAVTHAERLTALDALRARQMLAMRDGRLPEAAMLAEQVARRAPTSQAWFDLASVHVAADRCGDAITAFERALALDSMHVRARLGLADCALSQGNAILALKHIDAAHRMDSTVVTPAVHALQRGRALVRANRLIEADTAFRAMLPGTTADSAGAFRWLAQLEMLRGRYGEALPLLQAATRLYRQSGDAPALFDNLVLEANAFTAIGGRTRASELIDEAVAIAGTRPMPPTGQFQLGHLMARIGRLNGAREVLRQLSVRAAQVGEGQWAVRLLGASVSVAERNATEALAAVDAQGAPAELEPYRLALVADGNALAGQHEAALDAARRLSQAWHFGDAAQDEWLRATLRIARLSEMSGDTAAARANYRRYVDRWKDADVFLVELSLAQRSLVRLGGAAVASSVSGTRGGPR